MAQSVNKPMRRSTYPFLASFAAQRWHRPVLLNPSSVFSSRHHAKTRRPVLEQKWCDSDTLPMQSSASQQHRAKLSFASCGGGGGGSDAPELFRAEAFLFCVRSLRRALLARTSGFGANMAGTTRLVP